MFNEIFKLKKAHATDNATMKQENNGVTIIGPFTTIHTSCDVVGIMQVKR